MHFVGVLEAPQNLDRAIEAVSRHLALSATETRARLRGGFPLVLARVAPSDASFLVAEFSAAGLSVLAFDDAFLAQPQWHCRQLEPGDGGCAFTLMDGTVRVVVREELEFVCRGVRQQVRKTDTEELVREYRGATRLETTRAETVKSFHFLWVFTRAGDWLSADAETMRFRPGPQKHLTTAANLDALAEQLTTGAPSVRSSRALLKTQPLPFYLAGESTAGPLGVMLDSTQPGLRVIAELLRVMPP